MDRSYNDGYLYAQRVEEWREKRAQKMANRLQRNSDRPRTVSSSILGYGNYRQPLNLQPGQRHPEDPRYNNHGGDPRWNPNYNYSGYREHNAPHHQYQHQHPHDYRADHRSHGSYHQGQGGQKRGQYSSQKSLYNNRKSVNNHHKKYSSCSNINSTNEAECSNVLLSEKNNEIKSEHSALESNSLGDNVGTHVTLEPETRLENGSSIISPESGIDDGNLCESFIPDPLSVVDDATGEGKTAVGHLVYKPAAELDANDCGSAIVTIEKVVIDLGPTIDPTSAEHTEKEPSETTVTEEATVNSSNDSHKEDNEIQYPKEETVVIVEESVVLESENVAIVEESENVAIVEESENVAIVEESENVAIVEESENVAFVAPEAELTTLPPRTDSVEMLVTELHMSTNEISPISLETAYENTVENSTLVPNANEVMIVEPDISSLTPYEPADESLGLELSLNGENCTEVDDSSDFSIVKAVEHSEEPTLQSNEAIEDKNIAGTSNKDYGDSDVSPACYSETDAPMLVTEDCDIAKEIVNVRKQLANISIANNKDEGTDSEFRTPSKKERNKILVDATNILPSSTIKYAVREVRKKDETKVIVTPVRRSLRISSVKTPVSKQNLCVQKLEELSPEVKQKMKFVPNPSINTPSDA